MKASGSDSCAGLGRELDSGMRFFTMRLKGKTGRGVDVDLRGRGGTCGVGVATGVRTTHLQKRSRRLWVETRGTADGRVPGRADVCWWER